MDFKGKNFWALILGGSSGFGLASARKLAAAGMNICIVHRDRRGSMARIQADFDALTKDLDAAGAKLVAVNTNALTPEGREDVLNKMAEGMGADGRVRLLMHSIALGNLKLIAPPKDGERVSDEAGPGATSPVEARTVLAEKLGVAPEKIAAAINDLFDEGRPEFYTLADEPAYETEMLLEDEDVAQTVYAMGTSLLTWTQAVFERKLFADDARVLAMTSEGNTTAWRAYGGVSAAKTALESVSRSIALEFAPYGIRSNVLQAGVTDTPALRLIPGNDHMKARMKLRNPYHRLTTPEDVADVVALMCTAEAAWINGEVIRVDGGEHIAG